eukprot:comp23567_c0_seq3/m.39861 comp23567_c0_seq3/g.39861  ORF comp23567_c0_seq3/g.39861 comp23567_c0_seq3/m.39861 type:complete len:796 (-) comp23567_c0_seq3:356-2743(-)
MNMNSRTNEWVTDDPLQVKTSNTDDQSLTAGVGTSLYISPELERAVKGTRYNQKVDLYSLGIVLFEMVHEMPTRMERVKTIQALRSPEIAFPANFDMEHKKLAADIIRMLLDHNPRNRPSASELLENERLPTTIEESFLQEIRRALVHPNTRKNLVDEVFKRMADRQGEHGYDTAPQQNTEFSHAEAMCRMQLCQAFLAIFRSHSAVDVEVPMLMPRRSDTPKTAAVLMEPGGQLVCLPHDLRAPFARFVARNRVGVVLKRYHIGEVYRASVAPDPPRSWQEIEFDIVNPYAGTLLHDAEVIKVASEVVLELPDGIGQKYTIRLNHCGLVDAFFTLLSIPSEHRPAICHLLSRADVSRPDWSVLRKRLVRQYQLSASTIEKLAHFCMIRGDCTSVTTRVLGLFKKPSGAGSPTLLGLSTGLQELTRLVEYLTIFGVPQRIVLDMGLLPQTQKVSGCIFQVSREIKEMRRGKTDYRLEVLVQGGRYDNLVATFRAANEHGVPVSMCGMTLFFDGMVSIALQAQDLNEDETRPAQQLADRKEPYANVLVCSISPNLEKRRLELMCLLRKNGILAEVEYTGLCSLESLSEYCKVSGIPYMVVAKDQGLWVRNIAQRSDSHLMEKDLVPTITRLLASRKSDVTYVPPPSGTEEIAAAQSSTSGHLSYPRPADGRQPPNVNLNPVVLSLEKLQPNTKKRIMNKSCQRVAPFFELVSVKGTCDVLCLDVPVAVLKELAHSLDIGQERSLVTTADKHKTWKRHVQLLWDQLRKTDSKLPLVFLYSIKDDAYEIMAMPDTQRR